jgi:hypothetical protein
VHSANKLEMVEAVKLGDTCRALQELHLAGLATSVNYFAASNL